MKQLLPMLGLVLTFSFGLSSRGEDAPKTPDVKQCKVFALHVQKLVRDNDTKQLQLCFDWDALLNRATSNLRVPEKIRQEYCEGFKGKGGVADLAQQLCKTVQNDGSYTLLRVRVIDGKPRPLLRLITDHGFNYHEFVLETNTAGEIHIVDLYVALSGEFMSQAVRRGYLLMLGGDPKLTKQINLKNDFVASIPIMTRYSNHFRARRYREALREWAKLPPALRKEKTMLLKRVVCAAGLEEKDPEGYHKAMEDFRDVFPKDPAIDLLSLDHWLLKKQFADYRRGLDRINRALGGDPYLDVLRSTSYLEDGKPDEAKKAACYAIKAEPDLNLGYWTLVSISLRTRQFKDTVQWLNEIEKRLRIQVGDLTGNKEYREFMQSAEYKEWMAGRKK